MSKRLRVSSGKYKGWYIGLKAGLLGYQQPAEDPEIGVPGTNYALYIDKKNAFEFGPFTTATATIQKAQADLKAAGYDTIMV